MDVNASEITASLLDPLYDAATEPELWTVFLQKAARLFAADKAAILIHAPNNTSTSVCVDLGVTQEARKATERLTKLSPWMVEIQKRKSQGWYCGSPEDELPLESFRESKYYNELFLKHDIEWAAAAVIFGAGGFMPSFALTRPKTAAPFSSGEKQVLQQLVPHLGRVFKVQGVIGSLREGNAAGQHALDLMGAACMTLDALGRVLSMNRRAEALASEGTLLRIKERRLLAALTPEQKLLDHCLLKACACGAGKSSDPGDGAVVLHSAQGRSLYVSVLPYRSSWPVMDGRPSALLFITTPEEQGHGEHRLWQTMFGLSPAECRVAEMMKQGLEVGEISDAMRIKVDTVRYYQKCVYRKTGVRGQAQLLRLLARLPSTSP